MGEAMICHMCESSTDFNCRDCEEPVCESCCVAQTVHNQIDYALCKSCEMGYESVISEEAHKEWLLAEEKRIRCEAINAKRKATYRKPENVEKRRIATAERKRKRAEHNLKMLAETFKIVNSMMGR